MSDEPRETEVVTGTIAGVTAKAADQWVVEVNTGGSYTKKCRTKSAALKDTMTAQLGQPVSLLCNVSHWTNSENKPVRSLWIDSVLTPAPEAARPAEAPSAPQSAPSQAFSPNVTEREKQTSIERQVCVKAAAEYYSSRIEAGEDDVLRLARRLADFIADVGEVGF